MAAQTDVQIMVVDCTFCVKLKEIIAYSKENGIPIQALYSTDFVEKPQFEGSLIYKNCECGRMCIKKTQNLGNLQFLKLTQQFNPCGCKIYEDSISWSIRTNPLNCCGKCKKAIEMKKAIEERDRKEPFAIVVECSCHYVYVEPVLSVKQTEEVDEPVAGKPVADTVECLI